MHVIAAEDNFTLLGTDARRGKLTLFDAEGPREQGALKHVAPARLRPRRRARGAARRARPTSSSSARGSSSRSSRRRPTSSTTSTTSRSGRPRPRRPPPSTCATASRPPATKRVEVGGAYVEFHEGDPGAPEQPLLNHLAVLVDSADEVIADAGDLAIEVESVVDAANTYAAFLWGPERVRIEYVEHKPTFSPDVIARRRRGHGRPRRRRPPPRARPRRRRAREGHARSAARCCSPRASSGATASWDEFRARVPRRRRAAAAADLGAPRRRARLARVARRAGRVGGDRQPAHDRASASTRAGSPRRSRATGSSAPDGRRAPTGR